MFLVHENLESALAQGKIKLDPFDLNNPEDYALIRTVSIDLGLGETYAVYRDDPYVISQKLPRRLEEIDESLFEKRRIGMGGTLVIQPLEFMLLTVDRRLTVGDGHVVFVEGKSSVGRRALMVQNAGLVEPEFEGVLTLEAFNQGPIPIILTGGELICQLLVARTVQRTEWGYGDPRLESRYQGQSQVQPAKRSRRAAVGMTFKV